MRASQISESTEWITHKDLANKIYIHTGNRQLAMDFYNLEDEFVSQDDMQSTGLAGFDVDPFEEDKARVNRILSIKRVPFRVLAMKHNDQYETLYSIVAPAPFKVSEKFGDAAHPSDFPGYSDVPRLDHLPFYYDALEQTLDWAKARNVPAKGEGFIKQFEKNLKIAYKKYINSGRDRLGEAESVYVIVRKKDGKLLQKSSSKKELEKEFNLSPGYSPKHHYIKRMIDPQQAKAERDPTHIGEADIRAFPTPEDYPIAKMDKLLRRYGVDYSMFINKPFDIKLYELLIDIYMNWEGSRIERGALFYMANQYRDRGVRAGELPPSKTTESVQRVDEALPVALAAAGLWALRVGSVVRPAIKVGKWLWRNPGKTTAITVGADVTLNDGQDTKEMIDMVVDIKDDIVSPEEKKTIIKQIVDFVKANPGKSAVGFVVAFIAGAYALRAWFNKNDQYKEEDVNKVLSYQKKVLDKNPVQA